MDLRDHITKHYYDQWSIPQSSTMPDGSPLGKFVSRIQEFLRKGRYEDVFSHLRNAISDCENQGNDSTALAFVYLLFGIALRKSAHPRTARRFLLQSLSYFDQIDDIENRIRCILAIGDTWRAQAIMQGDINSSKNLWTTAIGLYKQARESLDSYILDSKLTPSVALLKAQVLWAQARAMLALGIQEELVQELLLDAWRISVQEGSLWAQEEAAQLLGRHFENSGHIEEARRWYLIALEQSLKSRNVDRLIETNLYLAELSIDAGDLDSALGYLNDAKDVLSPLMNQSLPTRHQFNEFKTKIQDLKSRCKK